MAEEFPPRGGSDILLENLYKYIDVPDDVNIIMSVCDENLIVSGKRNYVWMHVPHNQPASEGVNNKYFNRRIEKFIYVSHWQHEKFRHNFQMPLHNTVVIKNAIEPIEYIEKPEEGKLKIIFNAPPYRGLDVMLDAFSLLDRDDVELDVYSSTIIYGSEYAKFEGDRFEPLFERARQMKNVNYIGYVSNEEMRSALQSAHIWAYPCVFEETSCISMVEAGAAGCALIATNLGGLPETGSEFATLVEIQASHEELVQNFSQELNRVIESYPDLESLRMQSDFYNTKYGWGNRVSQWEELLGLDISG
jgi:glycosyltransferase involved in cell wall biosynthesis